MRVAVVIPALNEADNIGELVVETLAQPVLNDGGCVIVVDNGSDDATAANARAAGALVVEEARRGYGYACAAGFRRAVDHAVVAFLDGDYSSLPSEMHVIVEPILAGRADLVLGSRVLGHIVRGSMPPHQRFGNRLTSCLMRMLYGVPVTDLGPYRAIRTALLQELQMQEMTFGWPTEMMVKAARRRARILEVPVTHQARRSGKSKVSGTLKGSVLAAYYILGVTLRHAR